MAIKDEDQPGRKKPNESENQPQFAAPAEKPRGPELGGSEDDDTGNKVASGAVVPEREPDPQDEEQHAEEPPHRRDGG